MVRPTLPLRFIRRATVLVVLITPFACGDSSGPADDLLSRQANAIIFTEIQASPCRTDPLLGEWVEITNLAPLPIDINGWSIQTESGGVHRIETDQRLMVIPGSHVVLAPTDDPEVNGGVRVKYVYRDIELADDVETILLADAFGEVVDVVRYGASWPNPGCDALQLSADRRDQQANDLPENWCRGFREHEALDRGSPALANEVCPPELCGDGLLASAEQCDDGGFNSNTIPNACREDCTPARCGDGVTDTLEECDEGSGRHEHCSSTCLAARPASAGALLITEIMRHPSLTDEGGQWIELFNTTDHVLGLNGCVLRDGSGGRHRIRGERLVVGPSQFVVLGASDDRVENGGFRPHHVYTDITLDRAGGLLEIVCDDAVIDRLAYGDERSGWPDDAGFSMNLGSHALQAIENDSAELWCSAASLFGNAGRHGTPGQFNLPCWDRDVDMCRIQGPPQVTIEAGDTVTIYGRFRESGVTDRTAFVDTQPLVIVQAGSGPFGTVPKDNPRWSWYPTSPAPNWIDSAEPNVDEYRAQVTLAASGAYDLSFRVSLDGALTWDYCDRGSDSGGGSEIGYQTEDARTVVVLDGKAWGGLSPTRLRSSAFELAGGASFERLRELILGDGGALADPAAELHADTLARVKVLFLSRLERDTMATVDEQRSLVERVQVGGIVVVAGGSAVAATYESFTEPFGVTDWRPAAGAVPDYIDPSHPITADLAGLDLEQSAVFTVPADADVLATDIAGAPLIAVLEPASGSQLGGRVLVVGDYRWFTDLGVDEDPTLANNVVRWTRSSTELVAFPLPDDTRVMFQGGRPFVRGDFIEGVRETGLAAVSSADLRLVLEDNWLTCDVQRMQLAVNEQAAGSFEITPQLSIVEAHFDFGWVIGPSYVLRLETIEDVTRGCGSAGFDQMSSSVTLIGRASSPQP